MTRAAGKIRIGISGWRYAPWRGIFYPKDLAQKDELAFAAKAFPTIEINGTFYSLQRPQSFADWAAQTPDDFVFSVKGPRYVTHMLRLKNAETALANFFASGVLRLDRKLGPILWQLPPNFQFDAERLAAFFAALPRDRREAAALARRHDGKLSGRAWLRSATNGKLRHALEIRHDSFKAPQFIALLRKFDIALVCADAVEWPRLMDVTADFIYCRLHGSQELYSSGYDGRALAGWARRAAAWAQGDDAEDGEHIADRPARRRAARDVFVYFDNDAKVRAPFDAQSLAKKVARLA